MAQTYVPPGSDASFTFPVDVSQIGSYVQAFNLVAENSSWMPWSGLSPTVNIVPLYQWQVNSVVYGNGTGLMMPGTSQLITVVAYLATKCHQPYYAYGCFEDLAKPNTNHEHE
jgi:hypothetical protein